MSNGRSRDGGTGRSRRVGRRPDHWTSPHERATARAAEQLEAPLSPAEATWLEGHLDGCEPCRAIADAYANDRLALRQLRNESVDAPRDLWARTAAAIESESAARRRDVAPRRSRRATSAPALGALSGLAVVGVVVVATAISGGWFGQTPAVSPGPSVALASQPIAAQPTPIAVGAGKVHWLGAAENGVFAFNVADIDVVCPFDRQPDCAPFEDGHAKRVTLNATPKFVFQSPVDDEAVVVGTDSNGADAVLVVALPTPDPTPEASVAPGPEASPATPESPAPTSTPIVTITTLPSGTPIAIPSADLPVVPSAGPGESTGIGSASPSVEPGGGTAVAIITDVTIVGRAASYSPDGAWFAFSARPADGSAGPDIYVWHVGDLQARPLTTDHASVFASWVGGTILGSRPDPASAVEPTATPVAEPSLETPSTEPSTETPRPRRTNVAPAVEPSPNPSAEATIGLPASSESPALVERLPQTFLLDPWTGVELAQLAAEWQPAVDPTGLAAVAWQGTVSLGADGLTMSPAVGALVVRPFHAPVLEDPLSSGSPPPDASTVATPTPTPATPAPEASQSATPSPSAVADFAPQAIVSGLVVDFDARWDETGSWLGIWIADPLDPGLGRLSLFHFDRATGLVDRPIGAPQDVTALPGFSIGMGRLAWASPPGQEGEGSRIQIAAWTADLVGAVESVPVDGAIVIQ